MYLLVNESLHMGPGKIAAQVGHAVMQLMLKAGNPLISDCAESPDFTNHVLIGHKNYKEWLKEPTKIVLKVSNKALWEAIKKTVPHTLVIDAGYTEVAPNSETVIGLWPMRKSDSPEIIKSLPIL